MWSYEDQLAHTAVQYNHNVCSVTAEVQSESLSDTLVIHKRHMFDTQQRSLWKITMQVESWWTNTWLWPHCQSWRNFHPQLRTVLFNSNTNLNLLWWFSKPTQHPWLFLYQIQWQLPIGPWTWIAHLIVHNGRWICALLPYCRLDLQVLLLSKQMLSWSLKGKEIHSMHSFCISG